MVEPGRGRASTAMSGFGWEAGSRWIATDPLQSFYGPGLQKPNRVEDGTTAGSPVDASFAVERTVNRT